MAGTAALACHFDVRPFPDHDEMQRFLESMSTMRYEAIRAAARERVTSARRGQLAPRPFTDRFVGDVEEHMRERARAYRWG